MKFCQHWILGISGISGQKLDFSAKKLRNSKKSGKMTQSLNYPLFELNPSLLQIYTFCTRSFFAVRPFGTKNDVTSFHVPCCAQALAWIRCSWASALYHQLSTWLHIKNHKGRRVFAALVCLKLIHFLLDNKSSNVQLCFVKEVNRDVNFTVFCVIWNLRHQDRKYFYKGKKIYFCPKILFWQSHTFLNL